jgi:hypothetical protein
LFHGLTFTILEYWYSKHLLYPHFFLFKSQRHNNRHLNKHCWNVSARMNKVSQVMTYTCKDLSYFPPAITFNITQDTFTKLLLFERPHSSCWKTQNLAQDDGNTMLSRKRHDVLYWREVAKSKYNVLWTWVGGVEGGK